MLDVLFTAIVVVSILDSCFRLYKNRRPEMPGFRYEAAFEHNKKGWLKVVGWVEPVVPGKTWGNPETCCPDDGGYAELEGVYIGERDVTHELSVSERDELASWLAEVWEENNGR